MIGEKDMAEELLVYKLEDLEHSPYGFIVSELDKKDWYEISSYSELSEEFIRTYHDKIDWPTLIGSGALNEALIRDFQHYITLPVDWERIAMYYEGLSKEFLIEFLDKFIPDTLFEYQRVPAKVLAKMLRRAPDDLDGIAAKYLEHQMITPTTMKIIEKFDVKGIFNWYNISKSGRLSKKSLEAFKDDIHWTVFCKYRKLNSSVIRQYKNYIDWDAASEYQDLSHDLIIEFSDKVNIERLRWNKKVDQKNLEKEGVYTMLHLLQAK